MPFQLTELALPVASDASHGAWADAGSTCRKGGSTCVARGPVPAHDARAVELALVRRQIREIIAVT
jgi:hypothetical protein